MKKFFVPQNQRLFVCKLFVIVISLLFVSFPEFPPCFPRKAVFPGRNFSKEVTRKSRSINTVCNQGERDEDASFVVREGDVNLEVPNFSSHRCIGSRKKTRSCVFRNLYFDIETKKFEYHSEYSTRNVPVSFDHGLAHYNFMGESKLSKFKGRILHERGFLYLHAGGGNRGRPQQDRQWYDPWVVHKNENMPPNNDVTYVINATAMLWETVSPSSFGHLLVDNIIPIFIIIRTFELEIESMQIILMANCDEHFNTVRNGQSNAAKWCKHLLESRGLMSPGMTRNKVRSISEFLHETRKLQKSKILFKKVVLGGGGLAMWLQLQEAAHTEKYADEGRRDSRGYGIYFRQLQQHFYRQHGIVENSVPLCSESPVIVILDKHGGREGNTEVGERRIANIDSLTDWIGQDFSSAKVLKIDFQPLSWESQLRVLSKTSIFIAPPGSSSFRMLFLPKGAYAIILSRPTADIKYSNWESDAWFRYQSYFGILNYHVEKAELASNSTDASVLVDSDIFITRSKIKELIEQALKLQVKHGEN